MKKKLLLTFTAFAALFAIIFSSCASKPTEPKPDQKEIETPQTEDELSDEDIIVITDDDDGSDDEYLRSIANLDGVEAVSKKEFTDDKNEILEIISELALVMETQDTLSWLNYIDDESKEYYKNPVNLRKAQQRLRDKRIELKTIEDYFKYVFIPARRNSHIDEIRYVSKNHVKAVQIREDAPDAIYYEFKKKSGKWLIYIPPVS
ncbi:MAG: hypothetical protein IKX70_04175 [Treponema sp.]|nr:hypothetical protein [Treponema sp.]MBR5032842.1 hypothetical protein [Treponema sp.]